MNETKQTAVEWYITKLIDILGDEICNNITIEQNNRIAKLEKQAKEMEKEEMIEFAWECQEMFKHQIVEKFNETYGGNK